MSDEQVQFPELPVFQDSATQSIDWACCLMQIEVEAIRDYIQSIASAFDRELAAFDAKVAEEAAKLPEDLHFELYEENAAGRHDECSAKTQAIATGRRPLAF